MLIHVKAMMDSKFQERWVYRGPSFTELGEMDQEKKIKVIMSKKWAWNLNDYFGIERERREETVHIGPLWELLAKFGRDRYLDDDAELDVG